MLFFTRNDRFSKSFFILCFSGLLIYIILVFYTFHTSLRSINQTQKVQTNIQNIQDSDMDVYTSSDAVTKYILLWRIKNGDEDNPIGEGRRPFIERGCLHHNCYLTTDKRLLGETTSFDAIVFNATDLKRWNKDHLPLKRKTSQKYVFYGKVSSYDNAICSRQADNFFNWTWSYKLYSDIFSPFIEVKDAKGNIIAPSHEVSWNSKYTFSSTPEEIKNDEKKAMASIVEKCWEKGKVAALKNVQSNFLRYNMTFDIYGCKFKKCPDGDCMKMVKDKYYFYWIHEVGLTEDYLSDDVLKAYEANAVPVIFGGADLTKFLPPDSYINAYLMEPDTLVASIFYAIKKRLVFTHFFEWRNYYTVNRADPYQGLCQLCSFLKSKTKMAHSNYHMFRRWWYQGPLNERCLKKYGSVEPLAYLNETRPKPWGASRLVPLSTKRPVNKDTSQL